MKKSMVEIPFFYDMNDIFSTITPKCKCPQFECQVKNKVFL